MAEAGGGAGGGTPTTDFDRIEGAAGQWRGRRAALLLVPPVLGSYCLVVAKICKKANVATKHFFTILA